MWTEKGRQPNGLGQGIIDTDSIDEHHGFLRFTDEMFHQAAPTHPGLEKEARVFFKYGAKTEGYWNNTKFMNQVEHAVTIAEIKHLSCIYNLVFIRTVVTQLTQMMLSISTQ